MLCEQTKWLLPLFVLASLSWARAQCPVNSITIKGRVEQLPRNATVRVQLFYPPDPHKKHPPGTDVDDKDQPGEAAEAILDGNSFTIPVEFLTNDRRTIMTFKPECNRKPRAVIVTLQENGKSGSNDRDSDRVSFDFPRDFKSEDSRHYMLRSDLVLHGQDP